MHDRRVPMGMRPLHQRICERRHSQVGPRGGEMSKRRGRRTCPEAEEGALAR
jgi:hypothetical protein